MTINGADLKYQADQRLKHLGARFQTICFNQSNTTIANHVKIVVVLKLLQINQHKKYISICRCICANVCLIEGSNLEPVSLLFADSEDWIFERGRERWRERVGVGVGAQI